MKLAALVLSIGLIGCSSYDKKPIEVKVPVASPCLTKRPVAPVLKFPLLPAAKSEAEAAEHVKILWLDTQSLIAHSIEWDTAASGCVVIKPQ